MAIDSYAVDENRAAAQDSRSLQLANLGGGICIGSFGGVYQEGPALGDRPVAADQIGREAQRMGPSEALDHAYREARSQRLRRRKGCGARRW